jgi:bifunctional DNA-binding transcriptional regulator/antitoxin component of YhaV-PrlF toxin-antitoxin module
MEQKDFSHSPIISHASSYMLQLDDRGRIVLPKTIRKLLKLQPQEKLVASIRGGILRITPVKAQIAKARGLLAKVNPKRCLSDELIAERRKEAHLE